VFPVTRHADPQGNLDSVRSELRRLGYLDPGLGRYFLQDALRDRRPLRSLLRLAVREALIAGPLAALLVAGMLALVNGTLDSSPRDLLPLWLHALVPMSLVAFCGFVGLGAVATLALRWRPRQSESWSLALAVLAVVVPLALGVWLARAALAAASSLQLVLFALFAGGLTYALTKALAAGLLSWSVQVTERAPLRLWLARRAWVGAASAVSLAALLPLAFATGKSAAEAIPSLPTAPGEPVALLGIDGLRAEEFLYLAQTGELPRLQALLAQGARTPYRRPRESPASFWTTIATGLETPRHGVAALDSFVPWGVRNPLAVVGPSRGYWERVGVPLGLVSYRPVLANRREAFTIWELASRAGAPVLAVDWWGTYPASPVPGLIVSHGAYSLLGEGERAATAALTGIVEPAARTLEVAAERDPIDASRYAKQLRAGFGDEAGARLLERTFLPDLFAWRIVDRFARQAGAQGWRALSIYLPGLDIAAASLGGEFLLRDLARLELEDLESRLELLTARFGTIAIVVDPGRRGGEDGLVLWWRRGGTCAGSGERTIATTQVAAGLLRALGFPQSKELPAAPEICGWPPAPAVVETLGRRGTAGESALGEEYLKSLRALGYL
jgi:hypothetical protein